MASRWESGRVLGGEPSQGADDAWDHFRLNASEDKLSKSPAKTPARVGDKDRGRRVSAFLHPIRVALLLS